MKTIALLAAAMGIASIGTAWAKPPAGATGECKDGTYTEAASKSGACSGHKGVKDWFGPAAAEKSPAAEKATVTPPVPGTGSDRRVNAQPTTPSSAAPAARSSAAAPGGGSGKVWVNTNSKVYHCETDALYGKTKKGEYMSEANAKSSGARPARGKFCS